MALVRAADILAQRLRAAGCRHAFGMPGGEVLTLVDALTKAGIRFTLAAHENAAGFMAKAVWQRTGTPGIVVATIGPGVLNAVTCVADALQDSVPLIVLSGCFEADEALTYTHQVVAHEKVFASLTKACFRLSPQGAHVIADKALSIALEPRLGPVLIEAPIQSTNAQVPEEPSPSWQGYRRVPATPAVPVGEDFALACQWLEEAQRPLLIIGADALNEGASTQLRRFVDTLSIPFITTHKAKGIIPETHPLCLGAFGLSPLADRILVPFAQGADLVMCAGYDPIEVRPGWRQLWDPQANRVIDIAVAPNHHYMHQGTLNFVASVGATLQALLAQVPPRAAGARPLGDGAKVKQDLAAAFPADEEWGPAAIIDECRRALPAATLATVDSGAHRILLAQLWTCHEPAGLMLSSGLSAMGCAVPLALGAGLAAPNRPIVAFCGDAGFLMSLGELTTARDNRLKPIIVVFVDGALALIELKQKQRQLATQGVHFATHDYPAIARGMGGMGYAVDNRSALRRALQEAQKSDGFSVIAAHIAKDSYEERF